MRVTGGRFGGRALIAPEGARVRPTSDKVRMAIFNILGFGPLAAEIEGARVVDLFAGTGALGLDALSRGAAYAVFIDDSAESRGVIRQNVESFGLTGACKIWRRDATGLGKCDSDAFDIAFLDPPYRKNFVAPALASLRDGGWLKPDASVIAEMAADEDAPAVEGFTLNDERLYGETRVAFYGFNPS